MILFQLYKTLIEIRKPSSEELHTQMRQISPKSVDLAEKLKQETAQNGTKHLGVIYCNRRVSLAKQTISFVYNLQQKRIKSIE